MPLPLPFTFLLNFVLISRIPITSKDVPINVKNLSWMTGIQILGLACFQLTGYLIILALALIGMNVTFFFLEPKSQNLNRQRLVSLLVALAILSVALAPWANLSLNPGLADVSKALANYFLPFGVLHTISWTNALITLAGFWLATSEANLIIRFILQTFDLTPKIREKHAEEESKPTGEPGNAKSEETTNSESSQVKAKIDHEEYNAGRVIGLLERTLIYYLVLNSQFGAIGFILAAKGFTRFRELENRAFAEYVLIGTLLSALLAILAAAIVAHLLSQTN